MTFSCLSGSVTVTKSAVRIAVWSLSGSVKELPVGGPHFDPMRAADGETLQYVEWAVEILAVDQFIDLDEPQ